jgi:predicted Zn finger-like uncharacterized protein
MKFSCDNCGAKFQIADEKIGPRGAKVRCRRCDETIFLSRPSSAASDESSSETSPTEDEGRADEAVFAENAPGLAPATDGFETESEVTPAPASSTEPHSSSESVGEAETARLASLDVGLGSLDIGAFDGEATDGEHADPVAAGAEEPDAATPAESTPIDSTLRPEPGVGSDALEGLMERNELLEMQASLQAELANDLDLEAPEPQHDPGRVAVELGSAFEAMFGAEGLHTDRAPLASSPGAAIEAHGSNGTPGEPAEWFVAIHDEQIGPLTRAELETRWNAAEISPATLSWRRGLESWVPIAQVDELSDLPRLQERLAEAERGSDDASYEGFPSIARASAPAPSPEAEPEPSWRPSAARALDSLAEEELAEARAPTPAPELSAPAPSPFSAAPATTAPPPSSAVSTEPFGAAEPAGSSPAPVFPAAAPAAPPPRRARPWLWAAPLALLLVAGGAAAAYSLWGSGGAEGRIGAYEPPEATPSGGPGTGAGAAATAPADAGPTHDGGIEAAAAASVGASGADAGAASAADAASEQIVEEAAEPEKRKVRPEPERRAERPTRRTARRERPRRARRPTRSRSAEDDLLGSHGSGVPEKLGAEEVKRVLRNNAADVKRCVALQAKADPSIRGQLTVQMVLPGDGRPRRVTVVPAELREAPVGQCLIRSVKAWRFPRFSGSAIPVKFPVFVRGG